jgi:hypothetical protein
VAHNNETNKCSGSKGMFISLRLVYSWMVPHTIVAIVTKGEIYQHKGQRCCKSRLYGMR